MHIDGVAGHVRIPAVQVPLDRVARHRATALLHQHAQQRELAAGQIERPPFPAGGERGPLRLDPAIDPATLIRQVREGLYALGRREARRVEPPAEVQEPLVDALAPDALAVCIDALDVLGETTDGKRICVGRLAGGSPLLREIGRLRELTFRAVGEGTGRGLDVDIYDGWYEHIVLWDAAAQKIAGAYRVARGSTVLAERGLAGLYTASLFRYADDAIPRIAAGMELGRSFVVPEY